MALGFGATLVTADGRNDGGAGLRGQLKGVPGILGRRAQGEAGGNRGRDRGRAVVRAGKEDLTGGAGLSAETAVERVRATWAQVAASSGERRREAVLLAAERAQGAEGVAAEQRLGRGANARGDGPNGRGGSWAQKRGVSGGNGDGPRRGESGLGREGSGLGCLRSGREGVLGFLFWVWAGFLFYYFFYFFSYSN